MGLRRARRRLRLWMRRRSGRYGERRWRMMALRRAYSGLIHGDTEIVITAKWRCGLVIGHRSLRGTAARLRAIPLEVYERYLCVKPKTIVVFRRTSNDAERRGSRRRISRNKYPALQRCMSGAFGYAPILRERRRLACRRTCTSCGACSHGAVDSFRSRSGIRDIVYLQHRKAVPHQHS